MIVYQCLIRQYNIDGLLGVNMAGVGRVDAKCAQAQRRNHRDLRLSATADETQICYHLSMGRVYFRTETGMLYWSQFASKNYAL